MLDKFGNKLLINLNQICEDGGYKVVDKEELASSLRSSISAIDNNIKNLYELGYIDIKYKDDNVICVCTLSKARQEIEQKEDKNFYNRKFMKIMFYTCLLCATFSFLGAFLANLLF